MDTLKLERLQDVARLIQQKKGKKALQGFEDYKAAYALLVIKTGLALVDASLKGIPCGRITCLHGSPTSSMTTLTYRLIAQAQIDGQIIIYLDLSETFDAEYAVMACQVDEDHLLLIKPDDLSDAFALARDVLGLPYKGLLVLDAALERNNPAVVAPGLERLRLPLRLSSWTVVGLFPAGIRAVCQPYADLQLLIERTDWMTAGGQLSGFQASISILKHIFPAKSSTVTFPIEPEGL